MVCLHGFVHVSIMAWPSVAPLHRLRCLSSCQCVPHTRCFCVLVMSFRPPQFFRYYAPSFCSMHAPDPSSCRYLVWIMSCMTYRRTRRIITTCIPNHVRVYGSIVGRISSAMPIQTSRRHSCVKSTINLALRHFCTY